MGIFGRLASALAGDTSGQMSPDTGGRTQEQQITDIVTMGAGGAAAMSVAANPDVLAQVAKAGLNDLSGMGLAAGGNSSSVDVLAAATDKAVQMAAAAPPERGPEDRLPPK